MKRNPTWEKRDLAWNGVPEDQETKRNLSLRLDFVAEDKVGGQPKDDKENAQDNEVHVELCIFYIQQLQDLLGLLELAYFPRTLQLWAVHAVDGQDHSFEAIPVGENAKSDQGKYVFVALSLVLNYSRFKA